MPCSLVCPWLSPAKHIQTKNERESGVCENEAVGDCYSCFGVNQPFLYSYH